MTIIILLGAGETLALLIPAVFIFYGLVILFMLLRHAYQKKIHQIDKEYIDRKNKEENEWKSGESIHSSFNSGIPKEDSISRELRLKILKKYRNKENETGSK
jgi:hypothetical protein